MCWPRALLQLTNDPIGEAPVPVEELEHFLATIPSARTLYAKLGVEYASIDTNLGA